MRIQQRSSHGLAMLNLAITLIVHTKIRLLLHRAQAQVIFFFNFFFQFFFYTVLMRTWLRNGNPIRNGTWRTDTIPTSTQYLLLASRKMSQAKLHIPSCSSGVAVVCIQWVCGGWRPRLAASCSTMEDWKRFGAVSRSEAILWSTAFEILGSR